MASYNIYIGTLATRKKAFFAKLQGIEFFSEYLRYIAQIGSDFAREVKKKGNWQIARWGKDKIDNLAKLVYNHNAVHQDSKASQKAAFKTIRLKLRTEIVNYIC